MQTTDRKQVETDQINCSIRPGDKIVLFCKLSVFEHSVPVCVIYPVTTVIICTDKLG